MLIRLKMVAALVVLTFVLPVLQIQAAEGDVPQGVKAYRKKDFKKAASILRDDAEKGNETAQFYMGRMAENGFGMKKDKAYAIKMYDASANQGNGNAAFALADMYKDGDGVKKDQETANRYYYMAAQAGHPQARKIMANRMKKGSFEMKVTPAQRTKLDEALLAHNKDEDVKSFNLFMELAKQEVAEAQFWVARFYHDGEGVATNYQEAANWAQKSAKGGHPNGAMIAAHLMDFHNIPVRDPKQLSDWYYTAGHGFIEVDNNMMAKNVLAEMQRVNINDPNAAKLLKEIQADEKKDQAPAKKK